MKKIILTLSALVLLASCGKKQDDAGAEFTVKRRVDLQARQDGSTLPLLNRDDEFGGQDYDIGGDLTPIEYFDKKLSCGPLVINARRALKSDQNFSKFKVSEAEFHGLNQLPERSDCILSVISTNANGSTVTKNSTLEIHFSSPPALKILRQNLTFGYLETSYATPIITDYFEVTNPLPYPVAVIFRGSFSLSVHPQFEVGLGPQYEIVPTEVQIDGANIEGAPSLDSGYRLKIAPGATARIIALGHPPVQWTTAPTRCGFGTTTPSGHLIAIVPVARREPVPGLVQAVGFDFSYADLADSRSFNRADYTERFLPMKFMMRQPSQWPFCNY